MQSNRKLTAARPRESGDPVLCKEPASRFRGNERRLLRYLLLTASALMPITPALAGPNGGTVVGGSATINNQGSANVTVNQQSDKAIINWNLLNIGVGEKTTFVQPNANSIVLNKVTGGLGPSQILGTLTANGKVFLVNRDGIIFGPGAVITTAGFLATTSDIRNEDFMAGRFNFNIPGRPDASIVNQGTITATNGGFAALVAPGVRNTGTITAALGTIGLAAGNTFSLDFYGDRLITLGVGDQIAGQVKDVATGQTLKALVSNEGKLKANGGRVELTAAAARVVVDSVINTSGVIEANSVGTKNGMIVLSAATATHSGGSRGQVSTASALPPQKVKVSGKLSAAGKKDGTKGGTIVVSGEHIEVSGATIDASGQAGGGKVMIGGDWGGGKPDTSAVSHPSAVLEAFAIANASTVSVDAATTINASATQSGNGGKVILWANDQLTFAGTILALGGKEFGNGGFVETSSKGLFNVSGTVNAGNGGTWLLDPPDLIVDTTLASSIQSSLNAGTNVTEQTTTSGGGNGDIIFNSGVRIQWNTSATLTLIAFHDIKFNDGAFGSPPGNIVNTGAGNLVMHADSTGTGSGTLVLTPFTNPVRINWTASTGTISLYYNPTVFGTQDTFTTGNGNIQVANASQLTQYMLVNTEVKLQAIGTNGTTLAQNYALGKDINAGSIPNFTPMQTYSGKFDGLGHTISNLTIAPVAPSSVGIGVGLFAAIGATGVVQNVNFDKANVTANPNVTGPGQFVGVLAGTNAGIVSGVNVTNSTVSHGTAQNGVIAGGLVGQNGLFGPGAHMGTITLSSAQANVSVGSSTSGSSGNSAGGLVGDNPGTITFSSASGNVSGGTNSFIGGLAGRNENTASITSSTASGNVSLSDATGAGAGGLVGFNFGALNTVVASGNVTGGNSSDIFHAGSIGGLVGFNQGGSITGGFATGDVSAGAKSSAGGLAGSNNLNGTITGSAASGAVSSLDNFAGGLVGFNGTGAVITSSVATGAVSGGGFGVGGLVGDNSGTIVGSLAAGNVTSTAPNNQAQDGAAGGFAGNNTGSISGSFAFGNVTGHNNVGGFAGSNGSNGGSITGSFASGNVTVTDGGTAGGFVSGNHGQITFSSAFGNVTGGANTVLGGFAAGNLDGKISDSSASGSVTSNGPNSVVGGFAGVNTSDLVRVSSSGPVSGTSESFLGGLVGINIGLIQDSTSSSTVTGSGSHNIAGGLAGVNFGFIDPSRSSGDVSSGANSIVGGFVGANAAIQFPDGTKIVGTISPDSGGTGKASGGAGSTTGDQVGQTYPTAGFPDLPRPICDNGGGGEFCGGRLFNPGGTQDQPQPEKNVAQIAPLINITETLTNDTFTEKKQDEVVTTTGGGSGGGSGGAPGGQKGNQKGGGQDGGARPALGFAAYGLGPLPSGMPPLTETRFLNDEVAFQIGGKLTDDELRVLLAELRLEVLFQEQVGLLGRKVLRLKLPAGATVRGIIAILEKKLGAHFSAQPIYQFQMVQDVAQAPSPADTRRKGDAAQYIVEKLALSEAHLIATGKDVKVAVIDSEIDAKHPDLEGAVTASYDALPSDDQTAHPHGTGMAGAIASHQRLLGVAPGAKLLAVRAFGVNTGGAQGTSMNIVKGLQWAVDQGARVINMSFAGPRDPILQQAMQRLTQQGIILIAAAGNAGPKSAPLFPGADPNVIAVSATDVDDKTYKNANRGKYVAIAAPGVDILVPAPEGGYQLTTGTSVAAAHISGVVALMLERNKELKPAEVRSALTATAKKIGGAPTDVGAGLVDPVAALAKAGPKQARLR
ncbi:MAG: filamentous hemagglutinin N-terminal domain-containing protein [Alphaproteobacteria bacterium]|nr:MAG: filamentous hemagglutinin N-terminal domain-containing protein [Alphaproteobacteria bacterium]